MPVHFIKGIEYLAVLVISATVFVKRNYIGWIHLWNNQEDYDQGEPSVIFFNGSIDPLWLEILESLSKEIKESLDKGHGMILTDPRFLNF